jgi:hypothetical protein
MNRQALLLSACAILTASCSGLWNAVNRSALEADVAHVLSIDPSQIPMECTMIGGTRSGTCVLPADETQVAAWAERLGLSARTVSLQDVETAPPLASEGPVGCLDAPGGEGIEGLPAYWIAGRPAALALEGGGQFEYLLLIHDPAAARACVQASYASG